MRTKLYWVLMASLCLLVTGLIVSLRQSSRGPDRGIPEPEATVPPPEPSPAASRERAAAAPGDFAAGEARLPVRRAEQIPAVVIPVDSSSSNRSSPAAAPSPITLARAQNGLMDIDPRAEVWTYPSLLQRNAATNYLRNLEKLTAAKTDADRYLALGPAAKSDYIFGRVENARSFATELLSLDEKFKDMPWRDGGAVYDANLVLGRIAVVEGRLDEAKAHLLEAGRSTGSPVLGSFGPNMSLARDLLWHGERDTVLEFLEACANFWTVGQDQLKSWSDEVKAGRMPDFGANLLY